MSTHPIRRPGTARRGVGAVRVRETGPASWASLATAAAAGVHLAVIGDHLQASAVSGALFLGAAVVQLGLAGRLITSSSRRSLQLAIAVNTGLVLLWGLSRTMALPLLDHPDHAGASHLIAGIAAITLEMAAVASALKALPSLPGTRRGVAAAVVAVSLLVAIPMLRAAGDRSDGPTEGVAPSDAHAHALNQAGDRDPGPRRTRPVEGRRIAVGGRPVAAASTPGAIWTVLRDEGAVARIDPETGEVTRTLVGQGAAGITAAFGSVWVTSFTDDTVTRIDAETGRVAGSPISVPKGPVALAATGDAVWVTGTQDGVVVRIDPVTGATGVPVRVGYGPISLEWAAGSLWVANSLDHAVVRLDPVSGRPVGAPIEVGAGLSSLLFAFGDLWATASSDGTVYRIDPSAGRVRTPPIAVDNKSLPGWGPAGLAAAGGRIWVANNHDKTVRPIDPRTNRAGSLRWFGSRLARYRTAVEVVAGDDALWITAFDERSVVRMPLGPGERRAR
ncbi:MAG: hypothetical protein ACRDJ4_15525 [Actinomycetota bacterium]